MYQSHADVVIHDFSAGCDVCGQECDGAIQAALPLAEDYDQIGVAAARMNNVRCCMFV